jgi:hypothetical protein
MTDTSRESIAVDEEPAEGVSYLSYWNIILSFMFVFSHLSHVEMKE